VEAADRRATAIERDRPQLHIHPEHGWLNDPNGLCRIDGIYHVFYQFNPAGPFHDDIHWGHASSVDLLGWTAEPVALVPRPGGPDAGGCWSGCIVDDNGVPTAVYTGVIDTPQNAGVVLSRSDRTLRDWSGDHECRIGMPEDPEISDVRDPFVFDYDGRRYAVQGAGHVMGAPQLLLYRCDDLTNWIPLGPLLTIDDPVAAAVGAANIWECPNLFQLGDSWVLLLSLWRNHVLSGVRYLIGDLMPHGDGLLFRSRTGGTLDSGPTFYAPQILLEPDRVLLWGWAWEGADRSDETLGEAGWSGTLTSPRELTLDGDVLMMRPAAELKGLRRELVPYAYGEQLELGAFEVLSTTRLVLRMIDTATENEYVVAQSDGPVRLLVDGSLIECFGPTGTFTTREYPGAYGRWILESDGPITVWRLGLPPRA